jgi:predicted transglutaminase-like cysteine proteinase
MRGIATILAFAGVLGMGALATTPVASVEPVALAPSAPPPLPEPRVWTADNLAQWASLTSRLEADRAAPPTPETRRWERAIAKLRGKPLDRQLAAVNELINAARWVSDDDNYAESDLWATPRQFLARGGDCEDYAIAKLVSLERLGVDPKLMRVLVVHDSGRDLVHAVLAVATGGGTLILDNLHPRVLTLAEAPQYRPLYSVNFDALRLYDVLR